MPEPTFSPNQATTHTADADAAPEGAAPEFFGAAGLEDRGQAGDLAKDQPAGERPILADGLITGDPDDAIRRAAATAVCDAAAYLQKSQKVAEAALALAMARLHEAGDAAGARDYAAVAREAAGTAVENLASVSGAAEALLRGLSRPSGETNFLDIVSDAELDIQADR
ncbi:hypothetical protein C8N35_10646 [Breoghania corrubedonensis]|uniref:Uncharacterized protein n=1 Tax=Breoghania corrubedonensis TaxID=665038 RepID=A0A2T5V7D1_9HYPH|nr:hypothetical protein [Breoghania corrubedonensis]PTW59664.1 hypothetical protein C8N35_10646 [Breoghania corrubedonensis]